LANSDRFIEVARIDALERADGLGHRIVIVEAVGDWTEVLRYGYNCERSQEIYLFGWSFVVILVAIENLSRIPRKVVS
jgi:hypothetical protein